MNLHTVKTTIISESFDITRAVFLLILYYCNNIQLNSILVYLCVGFTLQRPVISNNILITYYY